MRVDRHDYDVLVKYVLKDNGKFITFIIDKASRNLYISGSYGNYFDSWEEDDICKTLSSINKEDFLSHIAEKNEVDWDKLIEDIADAVYEANEDSKIARKELVSNLNNIKKRAIPYAFIMEISDLMNIPMDKMNKISVAYKYPEDIVFIAETFVKEVKPLIKRYDI